MDLSDRARERLQRSTIGWLTTVSPSGQPQSSPVWYLWDGDRQLLIFSRDNTPRARNLATNDKVSFHLDGDGLGMDIVVLQATAVMDRDHAPANQVPEFIDKYRGYLNAYGWTPDWFAENYPVPVILTIGRVRA